MKKCCKCQVEYPDSEYPVFGGKVSSYCGACRRARSLAYYYKNKERYAISHRAWKKANPDKVKADRKKERKKNPSYYRKYALAYAAKKRLEFKQSDPEGFRQYRRDMKARNRARKRIYRWLAFIIWSRENPVEYEALVEASKPKVKVVKIPLTPEQLDERAKRRRAVCREREKRYAKRYPEKVKERRRKRRAYRMANDPSYRMQRSIRNALYGSLMGAKKSASTLVLVGLPSWCDFARYIESTWTEGMSWANYGNPNGDHTDCWHIDHIVPCCAFDHSKPEDQRKCWHYTNMQALWADENIIVKGGRLDYYKTPPPLTTKLLRESMDNMVESTLDYSMGQ